MKIINNILIFSLASAYIMGNIYKFSVFSPEVRISPMDVGVMIVFAYAFISDFSRKNKKLNWVELPSFGIVGFIAIGLISLLFAIIAYGPLHVGVGFMYWIRFVAYSLLFITLKAIFSHSELLKLEKIIIFGFLAICTLQYLFFPDVRSLQISEWDPHYFRVVGSFLDPGFVSIILVFLLFRFWTRPFYKDHKKNNYLWAFTYLIFAFTYSRSGYLAFLIGTTLYSYYQKSWRILLGSSLIVLATLIFLPRFPGGEGVKLERTSSIYARIINWQNSLTIFKDHPVIGVGFNTYRYAQKDYGYLDDSKWLKSHAGAGADSSLLFVAATTGIIGLISYIFYLRTLWVHEQSNPYFKICLAALLAHSMFLNSLFYPFVLFWITLQVSIFSSKTTLKDN